MDSYSETPNGADPDGQVRDMKRLLERAEEFAVTLRDEITALDLLRQGALAEVQREADEIRAAAVEEAEAIRVQAEEDARAAVARSHFEATGITEAAHEELRQIKQLVGRYTEAVDAARTLFGELPDALSPAFPDRGEDDLSTPESGSLESPPSSNGDASGDLDHVVAFPTSTIG